MFDPQEELRFAIVIVTLFSILLVSIIITTAVLYYNRNRKYLSEKARFTQTLLQAKIEIKEQTLNHLARELHDNLGQTASLIKIHLNTLDTGSPQAPQKIEHAKELIKQLIVDLKALSMSLSSHSVAQLGIVSAIEREVKKLNKFEHAVVSFHIHDKALVLDENTTIILYRMVQETLHNAIKHSQASRIAICLKVAENILTLKIQDNGVGFDPDKIKPGEGMGLYHLQERVKQIQGRSWINSAPHAGTTVTFELPIAHEPPFRH